MAFDGLRVGFDVDGVLADFTSEYIKIGYEMFGHPDPETYVQPSWDFSCYTKEENDEIWYFIENTYNFWRRLKPLPNTDGLSSLCDKSIDISIFYITSRVPTSGSPTNVQTSLWLEENFYVKRPTVICIDALKKHLIIEALDIEYFIDDKLTTVVAVSQHADCTVFLKDASYNKEPVGDAGGDSRLLTNIKRVSSVNDFIKELYEREEI